MPRALLSVSDKTGIVDLGRGLAARGFELVSTGGTARALTDAGLAVTSVSDAHRLSRDDGRPGQDAAPGAPRRHPRAARSPGRPRGRSRRHGLGLVDVVVVNLYPFVKAAANPATSFDELVEEIDIGGPSLVRAAAKNFRGVLVVVDPADYPRLLEALDRTPSLAFRFELMRKALAHTGGLRHRDQRDARARSTSTATRSSGRDAGRPSDVTDCGDRLDVSLEKIRDLRYGENPHQRAAWYARRRQRRHGCRSASGGFGAATDPAGQGAVVHEPARSRRGRAHRARIRRAGGRRHQAHEPVRRRDRLVGRRRLRARPRRRQPRRVRRHRRAQPAARSRRWPRRSCRRSSKR